MRPFAVLLAVCGFVMAGVAAAQTAPASDRPIARASATEVLLDLVVLDKHGKPVKNLKNGDVEIYEDDARQQLTSFHFVPAAETQQQNARPRAVGAPAADASRSLHAVNLVCLVFHNIDPVSRARSLEIAREFLSRDLPPETYVGMFVLSDRLTPIYPFSKSRAELQAAIGKAFTLQPLDFTQASEAVLTANPTQVTITTVVDNVAHSATTTYKVVGGEISPTVIAGAEVSTGAGASVMRGSKITEARDFSDITGMRETDKVINMITQFGRLPGRKVVLLLSTGLTTTGDPERFQQIVTKANDSRISIFAIDVGGLSEVSTAQAGDLALGQVASVSRTQTERSGGSLSAAKEKSRQNDTMNNAVRTSDVQASLRALSEDTGGFLIANTNEFGKPFQRIVDDMETHYEVTYRPTSTKYDGSLRNIKVKLSHSDWRVESRTGYFAMPVLSDSGALLPYETIGLALLGYKPQPHAFDFHTAVFNFEANGDSRRGALVIEIPGTAGTATPNAMNGTHLLHSQVLALVKDSSGQVVDKFSLDAPYEVPDAKLAELRATPLVYTHPLDLPQGRYTVETVVMDREGGKSSSDRQEFDTSEPKHGVALSSALLIRRLEPANPRAPTSDPLLFRGNRLVPFVDANLTQEVKPFAYFVVYPDKSNAAKPALQVELKVDGKVLANQTAALPAPDANGAIPMVIRAAVQPGHCELKITTVQGAESATRTLEYTVVAK